MLLTGIQQFFHSFHHHMRLNLLFFSAALLIALVMSRASHAETITCRFDVNDARLSLDIRPQQDIHSFQKIDLPGDFRFAGQWLPALDKFKAYVYHTPNSRYVLLTMQEFEMNERACQQDFGRHRVYDGANERELYFHCSKSCRDTQR